MFVSLPKFNPFVLLLSVSMLVGCLYDGDTSEFVEAVEASELGVTGLSISSPNTVIEVGTAEQFSAIATTDGGVLNLTDDVTWTVSDSSAATISTAGLMTAKTNATLVVTASYAEFAATKTIELSDAALQSITISGETDINTCTYNNRYTAQGSYDDGSERDISNLVSWSTDNSNLAIVDDDGYLVSYDNGTVTVDATRDGVNGQLAVTMDDANLAAISVTPINTSSYVGIEKQYTATGSYSDIGAVNITETVTWSATNDGGGSTPIAEFSDASGSEGVLLPSGEGDATITAECASVSGSTTTTVNPTPTLVSIEINGNDASVNTDLSDGTIQLSAQAVYTDRVVVADITGSSAAFWYVNPDYSTTVVDVSNDSDDEGEVTLLTVGTASVCVDYEGLTDCIFVYVE